MEIKDCVSRKEAQFSAQSEESHTAINPMVQAGALVQLNITDQATVQGCLTGTVRKLSGKERREEWNSLLGGAEVTKVQRDGQVSGEKKYTAHR